VGGVANKCGSNSMLTGERNPTMKVVNNREGRDEVNKEERTDVRKEGQNVALPGGTT